MGLKTWLGHYWKMKQPAYFVSARMRRDWNERARRNAEYFVATGKEDWTSEEFVASGKEWMSHHVLPDLELICQGRSCRAPNARVGLRSRTNDACLQ